MKYIIRFIILISFSCISFMSISFNVFALPSTQEIIEKIAPLAGVDPDGIEAIRFYIKNPECASTIMSYTASKDYSLVGFIIGLKATKLSSLKAIGLPNMNLASCKKLNAVQRAYIFIDAQGDKILGKSSADFIRNNLKEQINEGKQELDSQIASIPYIGTVLANWDCGCDAAFETNFQIEKLANQTIGLIIDIANELGKGKLGSALEKLIKAVGPKVACEIGSEWTGASKIPIVSDIATEACESVIGETVDFVIDGTEAIAETLGIIGGDHIPVEEYYTKMFSSQLGKNDYIKLADVLYEKCYKYFEPTNMSANTAKKVCSTLRSRYISESVGKIQFQKSSLEVYPYYKNKIEPLIQSAVMKNNKDFDNDMKIADAICEKYFSLKYPDQKAYEKAYSNPITPYSPEFCNYTHNIKKSRKLSQLSLLNTVVNKNTPYCQSSEEEENVIICASNGIEKCKQYLPNSCYPSSGNSEFPCCKGGGKIDSVFQMNMDYANKLAKEIGGGYYCKTSPDNPLKISCGLKEAYSACQKKFKYESNKDCKNANMINDIYHDICCNYDPNILANTPGVKQAQEFVNMKNNEKPGSCTIGGEITGFSYDPRIITCRPSIVPECIKKFKNMCNLGGDKTYAPGVCCEKGIFMGEDSMYDIASRSAKDIALAKKVVAESGSMCTHGFTKQGMVDEFRIVCKTDESLGICKTKIGERKGMTSCSSKETSSGYVSDLCCEKVIKSIGKTSKVENSPQKNIHSKKILSSKKRSSSVSGEIKIK